MRGKRREENGGEGESFMCLEARPLLPGPDREGKLQPGNYFHPLEANSEN